MRPAQYTSTYDGGYLRLSAHGYLCGPLLPHASLVRMHMHTREGGKHARHAAPARHPRLRALVCAAAGLEGVRGQDTTTWTAERMSETSAAVVTTDPGAVMGVVAGRSQQQGFGPRSTHFISNPIVCSDSSCACDGKTKMQLRAAKK